MMNYPWGRVGFGEKWSGGTHTLDTGLDKVRSLIDGDLSESSERVAPRHPTTPHNGVAFWVAGDLVTWYASGGVM